MMSYKELLEDELWLLKRKEILSRDKNCCQNCQNEQVLEGTSRGLVVNIKLLDNHVLAIFNASDKRFRPHTPKYLLEYSDNDGCLRKTNIYLFEWLNNEILDSLKGVPIYYSLEPSNDGDLKLAIRAILKDNSESSYLHINNLHVHHKYYQEGKLPWEYPDSALVTLCWKCHENLHQNESVPYLNKEGKQTKILTPCFRCYGAGYFPEFYHVQNGICFRCEGAKYEQLKKSK
jgi:5-methylcytosine-specific restriction endonuclease McrA